MTPPRKKSKIINNDFRLNESEQKNFLKSFEQGLNESYNS